MLADVLFECILNRYHDPLAVLEACRGEAQKDRQNQFDHRDAQLRGVAEAEQFLEAYRRALQSPSLEALALFSSRVGWSFENHREYKISALDVLDSPDAGLRGIDGYTMSGWFRRHRDCVETAYSCKQLGVGVTAIAGGKGLALSTVYAHLQSFQRLSADTQQKLLECMQHLLDIDAREGQVSRERNAG